MLDIQDFYKPFFSYFRTRRIEEFYKVLGINEETSIIDIGGGTFFWTLVTKLGLPRPNEITILNIYEQDEELPSGIKWVRGDARCTGFEDGRFDVAFSNSVIEHVGGLDDQRAMASEVRRMAKRYWVQTPDPRFPVEPHYLTPFVHWLPMDLRRRVVRNGTVWGLVNRPTPEQVQDMLSDIHLIPPAEFRSLFPDAKFVFERFAGWPKSMIAMR